MGRLPLWSSVLSCRAPLPPETLYFFQSLGKKFRESCNFVGFLNLRSFFDFKSFMNFFSISRKSSAWTKLIHNTDVHSISQWRDKEFVARVMTHD